MPQTDSNEYAAGREQTGNLKGRFFEKIKRVILKYPALFAAFAIYGYYLISTIFIFRRAEAESVGFVDYIFQYDSLFFLWTVAYILIRSQNFRNESRMQKEQSDSVISEVERARIASSVLLSLVDQIEDRINNPLTVIASYTEDIRKRFADDYELTKKLDHIDALLQRIHNSVKDVSMYQSQNLLNNLHFKLKKTETVNG